MRIERQQHQHARPRASHIFQRDEHDRYVEPEWCSRRLFEVEKFDGAIHDPCAGTGRILASAAAAGLDATGADIAPCIPGVAERDFFTDRASYPNVVSNTPYGPERHLLSDFALQAISRAENKVALLFPVARLNAAGAWLANTPLYRIYLLKPRPSIPPHSYLTTGHRAQGGRVDFAWWVWLRDYRGDPQLRWLERDGDDHGRA